MTIHPIHSSTPAWFSWTKWPRVKGEGPGRCAHLQHKHSLRDDFFYEISISESHFDKSKWELLNLCHTLTLKKVFKPIKSLNLRITCFLVKSLQMFHFQYQSMFLWPFESTFDWAYRCIISNQVVVGFLRQMWIAAVTSSRDRTSMSLTSPVSCAPWLWYIQGRLMFGLTFLLKFANYIQ